MRSVNVWKNKLKPTKETELKPHYLDIRYEREQSDNPYSLGFYNRFCVKNGHKQLAKSNKYNILNIISPSLI